MSPSFRHILHNYTVGIDPNLHAFLEFKLFSRVSGVNNIQFEYLRGDVMASFIGAFDVVFCLGVLYHTPDPIGMLKDIHKSMKGKAVSNNAKHCNIMFYVVSLTSIIIFIDTYCRLPRD